MCGFVAIFSKTEEMVPETWVVKMNDSLSHRGPDDSGIKMFQHVGLGHRRLSIIDLEHGKQPMADFRNKSWIVFNGEVYNYKELRRNLEHKSIRFKTNSDTEVLINTLSDQGKKALAKINGMFGLAYFDPTQNYGLVARDHIGIKPVYYTQTDRWLAVASEIKALMTLPWVGFQVEESLLEELFTFRFVTGYQTLFKGIYQLEPGEYMEISQGRTRIEKYWDLPQEEVQNDISFESAMVQLDEKLSTSIELQLVADVPVGTYLSGGVDSGVVTAISSQKNDTERLKTFIVGFDSEEWDERPNARTTAQRYKTDHHEYVMTGEKILKDIKKLTYYNDEPISHPNTVPMFYLSKLARKKVKVILTGEGADEMLSGYPRHQIIRIRQLLSKVLSPTYHKWLGICLSKYPHRKIKLIGEGLGYIDPTEALIFNSRFVCNKLVRQILQNDIPREGLTYRRKYANYSNDSNLHQKIMTLEVKTYLMSALQRLDRMSMANGLECRVPFLDYRLVEWVMKMPLSFKIQGTNGKYILKRLAEKYMDYSIIYQPKSGFGLPLAEWFRNPEYLKPFLCEVQSGNFYLKEYFNQKIIRQMVDEHLLVLADHSEFFWILLCLQSWYEIFK